MTRKELLKLLQSVEETQKNEELYNRPGLDSVSRVFLHSLKENPQHQRRKQLFESYTGYQQRY